MTAEETPDTPQEAAPLLLIKGDASDEEVAAVVAVLQGMAAAAGAARKDESGPVPQWGAPHRKVRATHPHGPGGWRASTLPR